MQKKYVKILKMFSFVIKVVGMNGTGQSTTKIWKKSMQWVIHNPDTDDTWMDGSTLDKQCNFMSSYYTVKQGEVELELKFGNSCSKTQFRHFLTLELSLSFGGPSIHKIGTICVMFKLPCFFRGHISCDALSDELVTSFAYICIHHPAAHQPHCDGTVVALGNLGIAVRHRRNYYLKLFRPLPMSDMPITHREHEI